MGIQQMGIEIVVITVIVFDIILDNKRSDSPRKYKIKNGIFIFFTWFLK